MRIEDYIDHISGRVVLEELKDQKNPSIGRMAQGYANVLM